MLFFFKDEELDKKTNNGPHGGNIKNSTAPNKTSNAPTSSSKLRCSDQTKKQMLGFLDEKPSFQPRINQQIPDFSSLHKALKAEALRKAERKDTTKCQPFHLRTSVLSLRQSASKLASSQVRNLHACLKNLCFTSFYADSYPTFSLFVFQNHCIHFQVNPKLMYLMKK